MESTTYNPVVISTLIQEYSENINTKFTEKKEVIEKTINNAKGNVTYVLDEINNKMKIPYTYEDLNAKEMDPYERRVKEYGIFIGNLLTNIVVDSVDNIKLVKDKTYNYLYPSKE